MRARVAPVNVSSPRDAPVADLPMGLAPTPSVRSRSRQDVMTTPITSVPTGRAGRHGSTRRFASGLLLLPCVPASYPGGSKEVPASLASPSVFGLPHFSDRGLLDVHSRSARMFAEPPYAASQGASDPIDLHDPPWLLPTGATVVGRVLHPRRLSMAPEKCGLGLLRSK